MSEFHISPEPEARLSEPLAFDLLRHEPFLRAVVRGLLVDEEDVHDVLQDTWLAALASKPRGVRSLKAWLARIARNKALDRRRSDLRRRDHEGALAEEAKRGESGPADRGVVELEAQQRIVEAVLALAEPYRSAIVLAHYEEMSPTQAAEKLGRKPATVRAQLHRAHGLLRQRLDEEYGDRASWVAIVLPLVGLRPSTVGSTAVGGATMIGAVKLAATILVALTLGLVGWRFLVPERDGTTRATGREDGPTGVSTRAPLTPAVGEDRPLALGVSIQATAEDRAVNEDSSERSAVVTEPLSELSAPAPGELMVRVVDEAGENVVDAPVSLLFRRDEDMRGEIGRASTQAADGLARFPGLAEIAASMRFAGDVQPSYSVRLAIPGAAKSRELAVDPAALPEEPLLLVCGPTGSLVVRTVDGSGEPLAIDGDVRVGEPGAAWSDELELTGQLEAGVVRFPHIGLGLDLEASVRSMDAGLNWTSIGWGPELAGAEATLVIVAPSRPVLAGRAVNEKGEPLGGMEIALHLGREEGTLMSYVRTDGEGNFQVDAPEQANVGSSYSVGLVQRGVPGPKRRALLTEPVTLRNAVHELGSVVFVPFESRLGGRCVDRDGKPIQALRVHAVSLFPRRGYGAHTYADGTFEFDGVFPEEQVLTFRESDLVPLEPPVARPGDEAIEIVLVPGGEIVGRILGDLPPAVNVIATPSGTDRNPYSDRWTTPEDDGSFHLTGLVAGTYTVKFTKIGTALVEVPGVDVEVEAVTRDPRLQAIEFEGEKRLVLRPIDTDGKPIRFARAVVHQGESIVGWDNRLEDGRLELSFPAGTPSVIVVAAPGYRTVLLSEEAADGNVVLGKAIDVRLRTPDRLKLELGNKRASLQLRREVDDGDSAEAFVVSIADGLSEEGEALVLFPAPGRYRLCVQVSVGQGAVAMFSTAEPVPDGFVLDITEADDGAFRDVNLPASVFP